MADSMSRVHRKILSDIQGEARPVFIDTPAGFELNSDEISAKAVEYFSQRFSLELNVVRFKNKASATALEIEAALRLLRRANYIFAGPGSPSYAVRNWQDTPIWEMVLACWHEGAHLVFASAAALTTGCCAIPVYEIYKAGQDPHWIAGLDLLRQLDLNVAVVPHWNNAEGGTYDTRFCYMGAPRLELLERQLDPSTVILGVDEYTACIVDPAAQECLVMGAGSVTVRCQGREESFASGERFGLNRLRAAKLGGIPAQQVEAGEVVPSQSSTTSTAGRYLHQLAHALTEAREQEVQRELIEQAHDAMHELADWDNTPEHATGEDITPLVELLIGLRAELRAAKQYTMADQVRKRLAEMGIQIQDSPNGTTWTRIS